MSLNRLAFFLVAVSTATASPAATYVFRMTGTVASMNAADRNFDTIAVPANTILLGDQVDATLIFDDASSPTSLYNSDPRLNIYYLSPKQFDLRIGSGFASSTPAGFASLQLWNDYTSDDIRNATDLFDLSALNRVSGGETPINSWLGSSTVQFHWGASDRSGRARSSDLITDQPPLSAYPDFLSGFIGFTNEQTGQIVTMQLSGINATLNAVPEPASWAMMIAGFALVGISARRRAKPVLA